METKAYQITETDSSIKIEFLGYPDIPLASFLVEHFVLLLTLVAIAISIRALFGSGMTCCSGLLVFGGILVFPSNFIWNYWISHSVEMSNGKMRIHRYLSSSSSRMQSYLANDVNNLRVYGQNEKNTLTLFEGVYGLRLLLIQHRGIIGFETASGMIVRFGWGVDEAEAEEIVAIIQQWIDKAES
jgi:hypothetical protein